MKRVIIIIDDLDPDLLRFLRDEGINVVAVIQAGSKEGIPSISPFDLFYRTKNIPFDESKNTYIHLSDSFLCQYLDCISRVSFMPMTEDHYYLDIGTVNADNVVDWAQFHAQNVLHLLNYYMPDEIWITHDPHLGFDNLFAELGRRLGLTILSFYQSFWPGKFFYRINNEESVKLGLEFSAPESRPFEPNLFYMKPQSDWLSPRKRFWERVRFYGLSFFTQERKKMIKRLYLALQNRDRAVLILFMDLLGKRTREIAFYRFIRRLRFKSESKRLIKCREKDLQKPFVYFALHYQPEASTSARGGMFSNQINAIEALRKILPNGWWICVKENPVQQHMYRDLPFFLRANQWPEVKFIDSSTKSEYLVKKSQVVATVTGTVGYESLLLGKPSIYFGDAWYGGLPNTYRFDFSLNLEEISCQKIDPNKLEKAINQKLVEAADGVIYPSFRKLLDPDVNWQSLMRTTAKSLTRISDATQYLSEKA